MKKEIKKTQGKKASQVDGDFSPCKILRCGKQNLKIAHILYYMMGGCI
jgi:hypothetical protein